MVCGRRLDIQVGQCLQTLRGLGLQAGCTRQGMDGPWPAFRQPGHDLMAQVITVELQGVVAGILDPGQGMAVRIVLKPCAGKPEQRAQVFAPFVHALHAHGREPRGTATAQQLQQEGFGQVILVMCADQRILGPHLIKQPPVPCRSRTFLEALLRRFLHRGIDRREGNPVVLTHTMTVLLPLPAVRVQVVVYMHRAQG